MLLLALACLVSCSSHESETDTASQAGITSQKEIPLADEVISDEVLEKGLDAETASVPAFEEPLDSRPAESNGAIQSNTGESSPVRIVQSDRMQNTEVTQTKPQKHWVEDTQKVWVVDEAAWTETKPIYEMRERSICNICGSDITGNTTPHNKAHMLAGEGNGYHSEAMRVQVGTETISHPEEGHWETNIVGGHWEYK